MLTALARATTALTAAPNLLVRVAVEATSAKRSVGEIRGEIPVERFDHFRLKRIRNETIAFLEKLAGPFSACASGSFSESSI